MTQNESSATNEAVNLLALDGGGIRGISELLVLNEIMRRIQHDEQLAELPRPCDYFDLIGGTSTGGLIALLLGRLRMKTDEALKLYNSLAEAIFSRDNKKWKGQDGMFRATTLEEKVKDLVALQNQEQDTGVRMLDARTSSSKGKAFVCAMPARNMEYPRRFRTYPVRALASANCEIWEAARATSAAPTFFKRIVITDEGGSAEEFVDGGLGCNNPTEEVLQEARDIFGNDRSVGCVVSIGTGHPGTIGLARPDAFQKLIATNAIELLKKTATDCEKLANGLAQRFQSHEKLFYRFNVEHGAEGISFAEWKKMSEMTEHTNAYLRKVAVSKMIDEVVELLRRPRAIERTLGSLYGVVQSTPRKPTALYTYPNRFTSFRLASCFVRREDLHSNIKAGFARASKNDDESAVVVLLGMGGSGKTQLAIDFCKQGQVEGQYSAIFWIDAANPKTLAQSYVNISRTIYGIEPTLGDDDKLITSVIGTMKAWTTPWLMVFDNYDRPSAFDDTGRTMWEYWPSSSYGSVLLTSRHGGSAILGQCVAVGGMQPHEGVDLLLLRAAKEKDAESQQQATMIVELLGHLPLAIDQAGAYIRFNQIELTEYPEIYQDMKEEILREVPDSALWEYRKSYGELAIETARSVFTTWELSFNSISGQANEKQKKGHFLTTSAFLSRMNISEGLFRKYFESAEQSPDWMTLFTASGTWKRFWYWKLLVELEHLALLESLKRDTNDCTFSFHPLIRDWVQLRSKSLRKSYTRESLQVVACFLPIADTGKYPYFAFEDRQTLLAHVDEVTRNCKEFLDQGEWPGVGASSEFGYRSGAFYSMSARHTNAEEIWRRVLESMCDLPDEECTAKRVQFLAKLSWSLAGQHRHADSKLVRIQAWELAQNHLGDDSRQKWLAATHMALSHMRESRFLEAETLLRQGLEKQQQLMGMSNLDTLATAQNLSRVYNALGRLDEAERYAKLALNELILLQGPESSQTLHAWAQLGDVYLAAGRYADAEKMLLECTPKMETSLGMTHALTMTALQALGIVYRSQKRYSDAVDIFTKQRDLVDETFGFDSPHYMNAIFHLAVTWRAQGDLDRAVDLLRGFLLKCRPIIRADNWDNIVKIKILLMLLYRTRKSYPDAEALSEEILADYKSLDLSSDLRDVLWASYFLYATQHDPTKQAKVEEFLDRAMVETSRILGPGNMALVQYLNRAQLGYTMMQKEEKQDKSTAAMLILWHDAGGPRYHGISMDNELAVEASSVLLPP